MQAGRASRRLAQLAAGLAPERKPYYVRRAEIPIALERAFPADGWYWVPADHHVAVFLGANFEIAAAELRDQLRTSEAA